MADHIREILVEELPESGAMELVWRVFQVYEAPDYSEEGILNFQAAIAPAAMQTRMRERGIKIWGSYDGERIVGVIAARAVHVHLLFVDGSYHRQGIARALYNTARQHFIRQNGVRQMTVNASPYAHVAYQHLGFVDTGEAQTVNGLRFIPMKHSWSE